MVASVFHTFKHVFKACFLGWHFLFNKYFFTLYTRQLIIPRTAIVDFSLCTFLHAYILYLILEPVQACWIGSDISHNPSSSALLVNRTPILGRPILCAAEVWRYGSGRALPNNLSKISDQSLLSVCIGIGGATGYWRLLEEPSSSCHIMETLHVGLLIFFENDSFYFVFWSFSKMFVSFYKKNYCFLKGPTRFELLEKE